VFQSAALLSLLMLEDTLWLASASSLEIFTVDGGSGANRTGYGIQQPPRGTLVCGASSFMAGRVIDGSVPDVYPTGCLKIPTMKSALVHVIDFEKMRNQKTGSDACDKCDFSTCDECHEWLMGRAIQEQSQSCDDPCGAGDDMCFPYYEMDYSWGVRKYPVVTDPTGPAVIGLNMTLKGPVFSNMTAMSQCLRQSNACKSASIVAYNSSKHEDLAVYYRFKYDGAGKMYAWGAVQWVAAGEGSCPPSAPGFLSASPMRSDVAAIPIILLAAMVFSKTLVSDRV